MHKQKYSLTDLENMIPWERSIYNGLLDKELDKESRE